MCDISDISPRRVAVVGQGYVGLPVAIRAVEVGFDVVGFDIDKPRVDCLRKEETFIDDITDSDLTIVMSTGRYLPTDDPAALAGFDVAVVCVPTPLREGAPEGGRFGSARGGAILRRRLQSRAHRPGKRDMAVSQHSQDHRWSE